MKFAGFYVLSGGLFAVGAMKTTAFDPQFGFLFFGAGVVAVIGALFEAANG